jgi:hypothetical protein
LTRLTLADVVLVAAVAAAGIYMMSSGEAPQETGRVLAVRDIRGDVTRYRLDSDTAATVQGPLGVSVIEVEGGSARFASSPCPHQHCVDRGRIMKVGEWVACLPNGVIMKIEGRAHYDGVTP